MGFTPGEIFGKIRACRVVLASSAGAAMRTSREYLELAEGYRQRKLQVKDRILRATFETLEQSCRCMADSVNTLDEWGLKRRNAAGQTRRSTLG